MSDTIPEDLINKMMVKCARRSCICRRYRPTKLQVHHIIERSQGGTSDEENLIVTCMSCHTDVHSKVPFARRFSVEELKSHRLESSGVVANVISGSLNSGSLNAHNYLRSEHVNELTGSYAVSENWLGFNPSNQPNDLDTSTAAIEDLTAHVRISAAEGNLTEVTLEGQIRGLQVSDNTAGTIESSHIDNAQAKYNNVKTSMLARAESLSGVTLHPIPLAQTFAEQIVNGIINYSGASTWPRSSVHRHRHLEKHHG